MALKRPNCISFSKKNVVRPFEDASSLEFWAQKNDASLFLLGQSTKKRPNGMTLIRCFDGKVLDMCEVGVDGFVSMNDFKVRHKYYHDYKYVLIAYKTPKSTPGHKPLLHFASELFSIHPRYIQLKSLLLDFFNGEVIDSIHLAGVDHVISVSVGPTPASLTSTGQAGEGQDEDTKNLPQVHIRTYTIKLLASGTRIPRVELIPMGPSIDLSLRRHLPADPVLLKSALKRPKLKKTDVEKGLGKKRKNLEVDEMGDLRGRVHVGKQDLGRLQTRKMKGLKKGADDMDVDESGDGEETQSGRKRRKGE
jgi:ribosome production factor 2